VHQRTLPRAGHTGDDHQHPERDVDVDVMEVVRGGAADLHLAGGPADRVLEGSPVGEMAAGDGAAGSKALDRAFEADRSTGRSGAGAEVDDVVRDLDGLRLMLHDENGVALVPQAQQKVVHAPDVVGMQARGGLVEYVGDVGERGAELADHLDALRLAARKGSRRPLE